MDMNDGDVNPPKDDDTVVGNENLAVGVEEANLDALKMSTKTVPIPLPDPDNDTVIAADAEGEWSKKLRQRLQQL
jgi:hypothetical protein